MRAPHVWGSARLRPPRHMGAPAHTLRSTPHHRYAHAISDAAPTVGALSSPRSAHTLSTLARARSARALSPLSRLPTAPRASHTRRRRVHRCTSITQPRTERQRARTGARLRGEPKTKPDTKTYAAARRPQHIPLWEGRVRGPLATRPTGGGDERSSGCTHNKRCGGGERSRGSQVGLTSSTRRQRRHRSPLVFALPSSEFPGALAAHTRRRLLSSLEGLGTTAALDSTRVGAMSCLQAREEDFQNLRLLFRDEMVAVLTRMYTL